MFAIVRKAVWPRPRACAGLFIRTSYAMLARPMAFKELGTNAKTAGITTSGCESCYCAGKHIKTHAFERIARVGSPPVTIEPCTIPLHAEAENQFHIPVATAVPIPTAPPACHPKAMAIPVNSNFYEGQTVCLKGMSDASRNGKKAVIICSLGQSSGKYIINLLEEDKKITVNSTHLKAVSLLIPLGTVGEVTGLSLNKVLNGMYAIVVYSDRIQADRITVQLLDDPSRVLSVKPENFKVIKDAA